MIEDQGIDSIEKITEIMRLPYEKMKMDLEIMIKKNYLENAYIDEAAKRIVLPPNILDTLLGGLEKLRRPFHKLIEIRFSVMVPNTYIFSFCYKSAGDGSSCFFGSRKNHPFASTLCRKSI